EERLRLRSLLEGERRLILKGYCGEKEEVKVTSSAAPDIADIAKGWHLQCEATLKAEGFNPPVAEPMLKLEGPWIVPVPEFPAEHRIHPVVFPFPRIDNTTMEAEAPDGFLPEDQPPPVLIDSEYGHYALFVHRLEHGYQIERSFSLITAEATVEEYPALRNFLNQVRRADAVGVKLKPILKP
ncbi:MAG: hypothetical protein L0170_05970, partial [Acidobacteria bacterium]|nr:hypothetical protein [Acidobacteriota bacterium]